MDHVRCPSVSPEPGNTSFPKRRHLSRLVTVVPDSEAAASTVEQYSSHSDAPPLSATSTYSSRAAGVRPTQQTASALPRFSKPGSAAAGGFVYAGDPAKAVGVLALLLLTLLAGSSVHRQRQLAAVAALESTRHQDEMKLQVAWLATEMSEHEQCKAALQKAGSDYEVAKISWQQCETDVAAGAKAAQATTKHLQQELHIARTALKDTTDKLTHAQQELATSKQQPAKADTQQQQHLLHAQIEVLQQQVREEQAAHQRYLEQQRGLQQENEQLKRDKQQLQQALQHAQSTAAAVALPATAATAGTEGGSISTTHSDAPPIVMVTCSAADMTPLDVITPWCQAALAAGVPRVMVVSDDPGCVAAAKAAGVKVLQHTFTVPVISGLLAAPNQLSYRRYAALKQVLSLGHAAVSVGPEVLLLADPAPLLHQHPTDVTVMSAAWADTQMAYGRLDMPSGTTATTSTGSSTSGPAAPTTTTFSMSGLSPGLVHLKPQPSSLHFVEAMLTGLAAGQQSEAALLNKLLLPPWHLPLPSSDATTLGSTSSLNAPLLTTPVTLGVLPLSLFTSSERAFKEPHPQAWLKQQQPVAIQVPAGPQRQSQLQSVLQWLQADVQEIIQQLQEQQQPAAVVAPAPAAAAVAPAPAAAVAPAPALVPAPAAVAVPASGRKVLAAAEGQQGGSSTTAAISTNSSPQQSGGGSTSGQLTEQQQLPQQHPPPAGSNNTSASTTATAATAATGAGAARARFKAAKLAWAQQKQQQQTAKTAGSAAAGQQVESPAETTTGQQPQQQPAIATAALSPAAKHAARKGQQLRHRKQRLDAAALMI